MLRRLVVFAVAAAGVLAAQDPPARAGRISYVSGSVSFAPAGVTDWVAATVNRPLTMGDQLYADSGARAEVHVPGAAFRLADRTAFEFLNLDDRSVQVRLSEGTLDVRVRRLDGNLEIDTPNLAFTVSRPGEYRLDADGQSGQTLVTVRDGEGQMLAGGGSVALHMGQQAAVMGQGQTAQYKINPAPGYDGFDRWVMSRNSHADRYAHSGYVSPDMVGSEDLGAYGTWRAAPDYGEVWVPNNVPVAWAPYQDGDWVWIDPWGWTWVDDEPWGFAPFHYGRWAFLNGYWGWCPGPLDMAPVYAPALVAWVGFGGGFGLSVGVGIGPAVGWFPLGPRDVYIPPFTASVGFVDRINLSNTVALNRAYVSNAYGGYLRTRSIPVAGYMNRTVPGAVMAVPQNAFASARPVRQAAIRIQPAQIAGMRTVDRAPHVAPQMASVLGRPAAGNVPRPPAAVLSRQIVARTAPPARPPSFAQRQALLARNPGRPLAAGQLHELANSGGPAASRQPVTVQRPASPAAPRTAQQRATPQPPRTQPRESAPRTAQSHTARSQPAPAQPRSFKHSAPVQHAYARSPRPAAHPAPVDRTPTPAHQPTPVHHAPAHLQAQQRPAAQPRREAPRLQAQHRPPAPMAPREQAPRQPPPRPEHH